MITVSGTAALKWVSILALVLSLPACSRPSVTSAAKAVELSSGERAEIRTRSPKGDLIPPCGLGVSVELTPAELVRARAAPPARDVSPNALLNPAHIDVLAVYTAAVVKYLGSVSEVEKHIREAERQTNEALANSAVNARIRVVAMRQVDFAESGSFDTDLNVAALGAAGASVRQLRDQTAADMVALVLDTGDMGGLAFGLHPRWEYDPPPSPLDESQFEYWRDRAFFAVRDDCIDKHWKCFAHELAHNLGAGHDFEDYLRLFPDAHGWQFDPPSDKPDVGVVGTMMSYKAASPDNRIFFYSNPSKLYGSANTGIAGERDNARAMNAAAPMVARYR